MFSCNRQFAYGGLWPWPIAEGYDWVLDLLGLPREEAEHEIPMYDFRREAVAGYTEEERGVVEDRLKALGYL
jgi:hypothetical protein